MKSVYIKNNVPGNVVELNEDLDKSIYNNIGATYDDYLNGMWVKLNEDQINYKNNYPEATTYQIYYLSDQKENIFDLDNLKQELIGQVKQYDTSREVNVFYINDIPDWWDKNQRMQVHYRLETEEQLGKTETTLWFRDFKIVTSLKNAKYFLVLLEDYAIKCLDNTNTHIENINSITDVISALDYNYKIGYPEKIKLKFANA